MFLKAPARTCGRGGRLVAGNGALPQRRSRTVIPVPVGSPVNLRASLIASVLFGRRLRRNWSGPAAKAGGHFGSGSLWSAPAPKRLNRRERVTCLPGRMRLAAAGHWRRAFRQPPGMARPDLSYMRKECL